jgi:hypothetical protein
MAPRHDYAALAIRRATLPDSALANDTHRASREPVGRLFYWAN